MYLLDTCSYIWLVQGEQKLPEKVQEILQYRDYDVFFSSITGFEIGLLEAKGIIELPLSPPEWFEKTQEFLHLKEIPLSKEISYKSTTLHPHHKDPMDRFIIATALIHNLKIITPDEHIAAYEGVKTIWK